MQQKVQKIEVDTQSDIKHIEVYNALLAWRNAKASEEKIPGYCILNTKSLIGVANTLPSTADELLMIPGIGKIKVQKYGASIIEIIDEYAGVQGSLFRKETTLD
ncbi:0507 ATP-dependent exoDNAse (exonuclease V) alpha subunit - helicase superfamily I member [Bonamia ostreae]|uniref:0507 ATP-dependent exoDNAse (Exonuclease V) alpha subunit - helicase superfamily I member n=1 Tax=Bonamia ostreae TaxID=126728 RepID=A0ABV2AV44_9EUKA